DATFTRSRAAVAVQRCAPVPLQSNSCTRVPLAVPPDATSMHLPSARRLLSGATVHRWALVPLQSNSWTAVPLAVPAPATSTHLPAIPVIGPVAAPPLW